MKNLYIGIFALALLMVSCKEDKPAEPQAVYPVLPSELGQKLFVETDYLDFIFHNFPFSMSQSEKPSIQANISYIGSEPVYDIPATCKPIARQFYQIQGEIVIEADVYYGEGCYFYVFYQDGQAKYANMMSQNGIGFFGNILDQAIKTSKNIGG